MPLVRSLAELPSSARGGVVSIGNFDGVHLGHAALIARTIQAAREAGGPAIAFTFEPHPTALLRPEAVAAPLTTLDRKAELLAKLGADWVVAYPTDWRLLKLSPEGFFGEILVDALDARAIVEGPNFRFGKGRAGDVATLEQLASADGRRMIVVEPTEIDGQWVSSSRVRDLVRAGRLGVARTMLTEPYRVRGQVMTGARRGAKLGFPTANLPEIDVVSPGVGVYAGRAIVDDRSYPAAVHVGPNPTFGEEAVKIEAHLIDFQGDLYGRTIAVDFLDRLRDVKPFPSVGELVAQLRLDVAESKDLCGCLLGHGMNHGGTEVTEKK